MLFFLFFLLRVKTATVAKLMDDFVIFFIGSQNHNFVNVWMQRLLLN